MKWSVLSQRRVFTKSDSRLWVVILSLGNDLVCSPAHFWVAGKLTPLKAKQEDGNAAKNLKVWKTATAEHVVAFVQKSQSGWNLQYTYDEKYCARVVTNEVQFFESATMGTVWDHLYVEGVTDFALSPGKNYSIAVFIPERKVWGRHFDQILNDQELTYVFV